MLPGWMEPEGLIPSLSSAAEPVFTFLCIHCVALVQIEELDTGIYHAFTRRNNKERVCLDDRRVDEYEYCFACGPYREYEMLFVVPFCSFYFLNTNFNAYCYTECT